jgi:histidinol-phosphate/aromatic aminotransferase/cobyric acid decarboxylase-like protein
MRLQVLLTNGVDEAIQLFCSAYLDPGDEEIIVVPTLRCMPSAQAAGARAVRLRPGQLCLPLKDLLARSANAMAHRGGKPKQPTGAAVLRGSSGRARRRQGGGSGGRSVF